jgi:glycosyltransferase involved in cell wall biosynthesis
MSAPGHRGPVAYLSSEIPALSATFVYEEMLALEKRGISTLAYSVNRPNHPATDQRDLAQRVVYLYDASRWSLIAEAVCGIWRRPGWRLAAGWLRSDLKSFRLFSRGAAALVFQFCAAVRLARLLAAKRCRHLHIHFAHVPTQIGMYASAMSGVPFTITAHANDIFERGALLPQKAARAVMMLTISEFNRAYLERIGVPVEKLAVVRCGVSFAARAQAAPAVRKEHYRIGTLGRLVEKKGVDVLVQALAALRDKPYRVALDIAGDGPLHDELKRLVASLGVGDSVHFAGNLAHSAVREWMHGLDVFVLACKPDANGDMDGIPVVLMEAMSQLIPVISTRLSGIPELVVDGVTGLLAEPGDPGSLAACIDRMLTSADLRNATAARACAHVEAEFGQQVNLDRLTGYFQPVMAR